VHPWLILQLLILLMLANGTPVVAKKSSANVSPVSWIAASNLSMDGRCLADRRRYAGFCSQCW